eukprot:CAMPEP_0198585220 /NCGR_PEP_ID=MMETSP1462-20131121/129049_1 /TAXON_ID=1333877 /ORGANISM="Brandtodinium nutriculum, Strain RCC3387" /LENGTH=69 /DNA_ID=CAMNT_0044316651 /DNA_START=59 /DNA_END=268 /DNA_ORIENTATION=+
MAFAGLADKPITPGAKTCAKHRNTWLGVTALSSSGLPAKDERVATMGCPPPPCSAQNTIPQAVGWNQRR